MFNSCDAVSCVGGGNGNPFFAGRRKKRLQCTARPACAA